MDSGDKAFCTFFGMIFLFALMVGLTAAIDREYDRKADLKAMELGYEQVVVDNQKIWRKVNVENDLVP